jgi:transposase
MMEEKIEVGKKVSRKNGPKSRTKVVYPYELRLKAEKLNLEEGISREMISRELGVGRCSVTNWVMAYRKKGEEGLRTKPPGAARGQKKLPEPATARIVELKKAEPSWGVKRIAQVLRRMFWLPGRPETVRAETGFLPRGTRGGFVVMMLPTWKRCLSPLSSPLSHLRGN